MSTFGIKTSFWGPHAWQFLFASIAGSFPVKVDKSNKEHVKIVNSYHHMFKSLQYTLPCGYCKDSYKRFLKQIPISDYDHSRKSMMLWLYTIHDLVNQKLIKQERECYEEERLKIIKSNSSNEKKNEQIKKIKVNILKTKTSPSFEKINSYYESKRAGCTKTSITCAKK